MSCPCEFSRNELLADGLLADPPERGVGSQAAEAVHADHRATRFGALRGQAKSTHSEEPALSCEAWGRLCASEAVSVGVAGYLLARLPAYGDTEHWTYGRVLVA